MLAAFPSSPGPSASPAPPSNTAAALSPSSSDILQTLNSAPNVQLGYTISSASSYSASYEPQNILVDRPHDKSSRWSGASVANMAPAGASHAVSSSSGGLGGHASSSSPSPAGTSSWLGNSLPHLRARDPAALLRSTQVASGSRQGSSSKATSANGPTTSTTGAQAFAAKQYIILRLDKPAVVRSIHFGKYAEPHPCNLKDFKVYGGPSKDPNSNAWVRLLRAGLRHDNKAEDFELKHCNPAGIPMPIRYIKLVPLAAHGHNYNFSVWFIALHGVSDPAVVEPITRQYLEHRESTVMRFILKHLRSRAHHTAYQALLESSRLGAKPEYGNTAAPGENKRPFEHPIVASLFDALVQGSWDEAEALLDAAADGQTTPGSHEGTRRQAPLSDSLEALRSTGNTAGFAAGMDESSSGPSLFEAYIARSPPRTKWQRLTEHDAVADRPGPRGGHQMVADVERGILWLFGGYDGKQDLADLWSYHIQEGRWRCVSRDTRLQNGPSPRSCHSMVYDPRSGCLYMLGRFIDHDRIYGQPSPSPSPLPVPSPDGAAAGGALGADLSAGPRSTTRNSVPPHGSDPYADRSSSLGPDHGATAVEPAPSFEPDFWRFSTRNEKWTRLSSDTAADGGPRLIWNHEMVFDSEAQLLYVFGGSVWHLNEAQIDYSGMWRYDVVQRVWTFLFDDHTLVGSKIPSRSGHSMLLDTSIPGKRLIWVIAGSRGQNYLADMHVYNPATGAVREISRDFSLQAGPSGGFTHRACLDPRTREIFIWNGLVRRSKSKSERLRSALWIYNISRGEWRLIYQHGGSPTSTVDSWPTADAEEDDDYLGGDCGGRRDGSDDNTSNDDDDDGSSGAALPFGGAPFSSFGGDDDVRAGGQPYWHDEEVPRPRYACQLVLDTRRERFFIFGGNPGESSTPALRLDDFWALSLSRPPVKEILRRAKLRLRSQRFLEMTAAKNAAAGRASLGVGAGVTGMEAMQALLYLQTEVSAVVNHEVRNESKAFRRLMAHLLHGGGGGGAGGAGGLLSGSTSLLSSPALGVNDDGAFGGGGGTMTARQTPPAISTTRASPSLGGFAPPSSTMLAGRASSPLAQEAATAAYVRSVRQGSGGSSVGGAAEREPMSDSDGLPSSPDEDAEMLSISQTLPPGSGGGGAARSSRSTLLPGTSGRLSASQLSEEGQPSPIYRQRVKLFQSLMDFFPLEATEPKGDLTECLESVLGRSEGFAAGHAV